MQLEHVNAKLLLQDGDEASLESLIPVFHGWIENQNGEELLIDVADYTHVPAGPGVVLIGNDANYSVDNTDGRLGVRYNRKRSQDGDNQQRLAQAVRSALIAAQRLEAEPRLDKKFRWNGRDIEIFVNDRLIAPNDASTRDALDADLRQFSQKLFGGKEYSISYGTEPRALFTAYLKAGRPFTAEELLAAIG